MERPPPHRQQETLVSTQYVLRVEQAHPSTFERHAARGNHLSDRAESNSDVATGRPFSQVHQESLRHCPRDLQLSIRRNGTVRETRRVAVARQVEEGRAAQDRAAGVAYFT